MPGDSESYGLLLLTVHVDPSKIFGRPQKYVYNKTAMIRMCYLPSLDLYAQQPTCVSPDIFVPHTIIPWQIPPGEKVARGDFFVSMLYAMFSAMLYAMFHLLFNPMLYAVFNLWLYLCMPILSISPQSDWTCTVQMPELSVFFVIILSPYIL